VKDPQRGKLIVGLLRGGQLEVGCGQCGIGLFTVREARQHIPLFHRLAFADQDFLDSAAHGKGQLTSASRDDAPFGDDRVIHDGGRFSRGGGLCAAGGQGQGEQDEQKEDIFFIVFLSIFRESETSAFKNR
jgi:hypothetical protein